VAEIGTDEQSRCPEFSTYKGDGEVKMGTMSRLFYQSFALAEIGTDEQSRQAPPRRGGVSA
jgi:hypothetical protein